MAKAPKRTTIADAKPPQSTPNDWMPLTAAFLQIQQVVAGEELAEEDLRLRLASGEVEAQDWLVTPGEGIEIIPLAPEDFKGPDGLFFWPVPELHDKLGPVIRRIDFLRRVEIDRVHGHNYFVRRGDVDRIWPIVGYAEERRARIPQRTDAAEKPQVLPPSKVKKAADAVLALTRQGYAWGWGEREALLTKVRELTGDKSLSISTLKRAFNYLRDEGLMTERGIAKLVQIGSEPT
jgi:hypothetical protein